jgi:hypothetical protein
MGRLSRTLVDGRDRPQRSRRPAPHGFESTEDSNRGGVGGDTPELRTRPATPTLSWSMLRMDRNAYAVPVTWKSAGASRCLFREHTQPVLDPRSGS